MDNIPKEIHNILLNFCGDLITINSYMVLSRWFNNFVENYLKLEYLQHNDRYTVLRPEKLKYLVYFDCRNCINANTFFDGLSYLKKAIYCNCNYIKTKKFKRDTCIKCYLSLVPTEVSEVCLYAMKYNSLCWYEKNKF